MVLQPIQGGASWFCDTIMAVPTTVLLRKGGFRTFTSCEGGRGHSFQHATIGLELDDGFPAFKRRLVKFLRSQGMASSSISFRTDFHETYPEGQSMVYLEGLDILSEGKRKRVLEAIKRKEQRLRRQLGMG